MADLSDVTNALGQMVQSALYPGQPSPSGNSVAGVPVLIQSGWPDPASIDKLVSDFNTAISVPRAQVTVYPRPTERNTTRYSRQVKQSGPLQAATFTLANSSGYVVTVGGAQPSTFYPQNFAIFVNGVSYLYRSLIADTLASIATALAALIAVGVPGTTASGPNITIPGPVQIGALRVGTQAPTAQEVKRQEREFQLVVWAPSPALRDQVAAPVDVLVGQTSFLTFPDGSKGRLIYHGSPFTDFDQKQGIYRRDLIVTVEYATLAISTAPEAIAIKTVYSQEAPDGSKIAPPIDTTYN